jgi:hypothetical protein
MYYTRDFFFVNIFVEKDLLDKNFSAVVIAGSERVSE